MSDSSNICLACGCCCDGTLIGFVQLDPEEVPRLKQIMTIEEENGHGLFLHPCKKYCDGCTIYSERPKQCASFECGLLKSVDQKELAFDSAVEIVKEVKHKKAVIEEKLSVLALELKSKSFYFKMVELKKLLRAKEVNRSLTREHLDVRSEINQLDRLLLERFKITLD